MAEHERAGPADVAAGEVTRLLRALGEGHGEAQDELYAAVHGQLRALARRYVADDDTLQPTALVHEAFLRLSRSGGAQADRNHFFSVAAKAMRRIAVDHDRRRRSLKRGGGRKGTPVPEDAAAEHDEFAELDQVALDEALSDLEGLSAEQARVAELRIYAGVGIEECAQAMDRSTATVERRWRAAQAFLRSRLGPPA